MRGPPIETSVSCLESAILVLTASRAKFPPPGRRRRRPVIRRSAIPDTYPLPANFVTLTITLTESHAKAHKAQRFVRPFRRTERLILAQQSFHVFFAPWRLCVRP